MILDSRITNGVAPGRRKYKEGDTVRVLNSEPADRIRGIDDGAIGAIVQAERRDGDFVYRCPLVKFGEQALWMAMHQLELA